MDETQPKQIAVKQTILVVDDMPDNIELLTEVLNPYYRTKIATNGEKALKIAFSSSKPDLILLDIMMPGISGYDVCQKLKDNPDTRNVPVIFVTAMNEVTDEKKGLEMGAVDYITKPISPAIVLARVKTHLALYDQTRMLEHMVEQRTAELEKTRRQIIRRLGRASEFKDNETGNHVIRMSHYARLIAAAMGKSDEFVDILFNAAPMHDVGKIGIPDNVLLKPGKLDEEQWKIMRTHPKMGAEIIGTHSDELLKTAQIVSLTHHEKWDGSGYPNQLKGEEIPLMGRIIAIADVFDALTSDRPYKRAWTIEDAVRIIEEGAGTHFDPGLIAPFKSVLPDMIKIRDKYAESHGALTDMDFNKTEV
ncbi:MAG: two-component system response regulator [Nitrospirae bacterium]|nr:two-component system response regulator [Nitrospirota bacterium]MBF0540249.1 two-component system response regulator [Nitrospirota bacterium]